ncbi:hypothetical protein DRJ17_02165 [Candidatus Woesearchaeota archaeon]|nr:MAG: hypothetical protein DRJ17_02165 [Candidatus Woesearchaeota archaeon]
MRLSNKLIDEVIAEVAGEDVIPLVKAMKNKKNISEFKLAENIEREVNETRNMLYRLHNANLVTFIRRKDKKKGWYIYYWTFNAKRIKHLVFKLKKERVEKLKDRLIREKNHYFFSCSNKCIRLDFEQATEFEFKCPECGSLIEQEDNTLIIKNVEDEIFKLEKELKTYNSSG